jgi:DNA-binding response OmpR family regulator
MAGAPILVVDDSPVNLQFMRLLLTYEGFEVRTSEGAEEALQMLYSFRPALVLTDIQMPGIDGVEMTRRIKSDRRTSGIRVAAMTSSTSPLDRERALAAGCESCIIKTEDTATLAARLRRMLGETPPPPLAIEPAAPTRESLTGYAASLRRRHFLEAAVERASFLLKSFDTHMDSLAISAQLHAWSSDVALGFPNVIKLARYGEDLLAESPLRTLALRECLSDLYFAFEDLLAEEAAPPEYILQALRGKRVALVGLPANRCDVICSALGRVEARPLLFSMADVCDSPSIRNCDLIVLHVQEGMDSAKLEALAGDAAKLVLAGERRDLLEVAGTLPVSAAEFLVGNWEPEEVLMRLALAATRPAAQSKQAVPQPPAVRPRDSVSAPTVVLADDDPVVLTILRGVLGNYGMRCHTAEDGLQALRLIRQIQPQVAVLDINMPEVSGFEVLSALRMENMSTPVVMLSAHQKEDDVLRAFHLGADDYLVKPFNPMELVARVKRLLRQGAIAQ